MSKSNDLMCDHTEMRETAKVQSIYCINPMKLVGFMY